MGTDTAMGTVTGSAVAGLDTTDMVTGVTRHYSEQERLLEEQKWPRKY